MTRREKLEELARLLGADELQGRDELSDGEFDDLIGSYLGMAVDKAAVSPHDHDTLAPCDICDLPWRVYVKLALAVLGRLDLLPLALESLDSGEPELAPPPEPEPAKPESHEPEHIQYVLPQVNIQIRNALRANPNRSDRDIAKSVIPPCTRQNVWAIRQRVKREGLL